MKIGEERRAWGDTRVESGIGVNMHFQPLIIPREKPRLIPRPAKALHAQVIGHS